MSAVVSFTYSLQWDGDRTPGRRGGGIGIEGEPVAFEIDVPAATFEADPLGAATELWAVELRFLEWAALHYPEHRLVRWTAHLGSPEGPELSRFMSGFTASE